MALRHIFYLLELGKTLTVHCQRRCVAVLHAPFRGFEYMPTQKFSKRAGTPMVFISANLRHYMLIRMLTYYSAAVEACWLLPIPLRVL